MRMPKPIAARAPCVIAPVPKPVARVIRAPLPCFDPAPNPLTPPSSDHPEETVKQELDDIQRGFRERRAAEQERYKQATSLGYYFVAAFETPEQCDKFLAYFGIGNAEGSLFIDGRRLADKLGIDLPKSYLVRRNKKDDRLKALVRPSPAKK